jgi:hypothetical protein
MTDSSGFCLFDVGCSFLVQQTADSSFVWLVGFDLGDSRQQTSGGQQSTGAGSSR